MMRYHLSAKSFVVSSIAMMALSTSTNLAIADPLRGKSTPQYVMISFDGAGPLAQWERSLALSAKTGARFTYFLSCVNLLPKDLAQIYKNPEGRTGRSNVGFAQSKEEVHARLSAIWRAASSGHEIANHACGHFDGKVWTKEQWLSEFQSFDSILSNAYLNNKIGYEPDGWRAFVRNSIRGFRAPYLSNNKALYEALSTRGFAYDASGVEREGSVPRGNKQLAKFSLPLIPEGPSDRRIVAMDYNLFVRHSGGFERASDGAAFEERSYMAFRQAFVSQYHGKRRPLQIGLHFTLMNGGAYWRAMERLVTDVCNKPDVRCTTYSKYLEENPLAGDKIAELEPHKGGS